MTAGQRLRAERLRCGCDGGTKSDPSGLQKGPAYQAREDIPAGTQQHLPEQKTARLGTQASAGKEEGASKSHGLSSYRETPPQRHLHWENSSAPAAE